MQINDTVVLDGVRRTGDGYLVASAKVARTGIQIYGGAEVGKPDMATVRIYRPEAEVFSKDALASFTHRPVTMNHPPELVTADNWQKHAKGWTSGEVARDGEHIRVAMLIADKATISAIEGGTRELSMGYTTDLKWEAGTTPSGEAYDAIQTAIRGNHLAVVAAARGGPALRIGDNHEGDRSMTTRTITVDGLSVDLTDKDAQIVLRAMDAAAKALADAATKATADAARIADLTTAVSTKDGEIAVLKKQVTDSALTPAKLDAAVAARAAVIGDAKRIAGDKLVTDGKTDIEIKRAAIALKLGDDTAKALDDAAIAGAFAYAAKDAKPVDPLARVISDIRPVATDAAAEVAAFDASVSDLNAWRTKTA